MTYEERSTVRAEFYRLLGSSKLSADGINRCVELIRIIGEGCGDCESAHGMEDELFVTVLQRSRSPLAKAALQTTKLNFSRWYA